MASTTTTAEDNMASAARKLRYTPEEYLALERRAEYRSEYLDGTIFAMAGGTRVHSLIAANVIRRIGNQLDNRPCEAHTSDMRVLVSQTGLYTYPDVTVVCGEPLFLDEKQDTLLNPTVIVEVLSPKTEAYDRGKKFEHYSRLPSLREYNLVAQDEVLVERFLREGDNWRSTRLRSLDETLQVSSIDCSIPLREIFAKVVFASAPAAGTQRPQN